MNGGRNEKGIALQIVISLIVFAIVVVLIVSSLKLGIFKDQRKIGEVVRENAQEVTRDALETIKTDTQIAPSPTPFPFQEMTIPHLRNREYKSSLSELVKHKETAEFTTYLTSYDSDGHKVNGYLNVPKGEKPANGWKAIVFIHGYIPPNQYQTTQNYASYADYLARNDLVVFKIDLRGHGQSEGEASGAYYSEDYVVDTLNAVASLSSSDFVNPESIGLWGHSMGGNVVLRSFVASESISAAVIWAGAVYTYEDMQEYGIDDNSYRPPPEDSPRVKERNELRELYGNFDKTSEFWKQVVPTNYLSGLQGAVQLHHAQDDNVVSIDYSRNLVKILNNTGIANQLYEYGAGGHNLTGNSFTQAMERSVEFFHSQL